ncbi:Protein canopy -like protein 4 [Echinococcus granulosus]|nr:Protein canopy -like protein 4 [Echinococcus granulosus]KAH9280495.1 Protein canopy -like protein 4 [Echinococcus granulosus]
MLLILLSFLFLSSNSFADLLGVEAPTACEVCKLFCHEFMLRYNATDSSAMLDFHGASNKKVPYSTSELRLTEIMQDPDLCTSMLQYRLHNERKDSTRFQKSRPQTFETLRQLVDRGVDVKLDIPLSLWDSPSVEISMLKEKCEQLVVEYESLIEEWFFDHHDETSIVDYLCRQRLLKNMPLACLDEPMLVESSQEGSRGVSSVPSHEPSSEDGAGSKEQAEYSNARPLTEL